ncbi:unnamed protein product [Rhizophagus irregularis]|nr:unnamed protein product [Rhizophagus irregularis]
MNNKKTHSFKKKHYNNPSPVNQKSCSNLNNQQIYRLKTRQRLNLSDIIKIASLNIKGITDVKKQFLIDILEIIMLLISQMKKLIIREMAGNKKMRIINYYGKSGRVTLDNFNQEVKIYFDKIKELVRESKAQNAEIILLGDFNLHYEKYLDDKNNNRKNEKRT